MALIVAMPALWSAVVIELGITEAIGRRRRWQISGECGGGYATKVFGRISSSTSSLLECHSVDRSIDSLIISGFLPCDQEQEISLVSYGIV